jgi:ElaB/YqjD/DUF883 family membrane-anchored ribosome-binding protein
MNRSTWLTPQASLAGHPRNNHDFDPFTHRPDSGRRPGPDARHAGAHGAGQMNALEDRVVGMAHDATEAVDDAVRGVRDAVHAAAEQVRGASESALASVRRALDVRRHVRRHPWLAVGSAVVLGLICGRFVGRR